MIRLRSWFSLSAEIVVALAVILGGGSQSVTAQKLPDEVYISSAPENRASSVQPWKSAPPQWTKMLDYYTQNNIFPGVSVLIKSPKWGVRFVSSGRPIVDREDIPFKPTTQFRIGSCSKATVSMVILQLDYEHKLNIDDPITRHLPPEISSRIPYAEDITIRNCLDMTSGLRSYTDIPKLSDPTAETSLDVYKPEQVLNMAMDYNSASFLPGTTTDGEIHKYEYTNTGYLLCGLIAERIEKKPLNVILQERVFNKIGMTDTFLATDYRITHRMAHGYTAFYETGAWQDCVIYDQSVPWAAGAVISTPFDLLNFYETIFTSDRLLKPLSRQKFLMMNYATEHKGYGKAILEEMGDYGAMLGHGGTVLGYLTLTLYSPDADFYYVSYINTWDNKYARVEVFDRIAFLAFGSPEEPTPTDGARARTSAGAVSLAWHPGNLSGEEYHVYVGENESSVLNATVDSHAGVSLDRVKQLNFAKRGLQSGKRYYWRVDTHHKRSEKEIEREREDIEVLMENYNTYKYREVSEYVTIPSPVWMFTAE
ncbi:MAG: serine hydrolase [Candidatus Latescibacterota bacterium]